MTIYIYIYVYLSLPGLTARISGLYTESTGGMGFFHIYIDIFLLNSYRIQQDLKFIEYSILILCDVLKCFYVCQHIHIDHMAKILIINRHVLCDVLKYIRDKISFSHTN